MKTDEALKVLIEVAHLAQSKGILTLQEAPIVLQAVETLIKKDEKKTMEEEVKEVAVEETVKESTEEVA